MLTVEIDPAEAGFDARRLARVDTHFARYVDEGKLPGFLAVIAREGRVVTPQPCLLSLLSLTDEQDG